MTLNKFEREYMENMFDNIGDEEEAPDCWDEEESYYSSDEEDIVPEPVSIQMNLLVPIAPRPINLERNPGRETVAPETFEIIETILPLKWCESVQFSGQKRKLDQREYPSLIYSAEKRVIRHPKMPRFTLKKKVSLKDFLAGASPSEGWQTKSGHKKSVKKQVPQLKTKMCFSYNTDKTCSRSDCHFAHKPEELFVPRCRFDDECKFVVYIEDEWMNAGSDRICHRLHKGETRSDFYSRVGLV